MKLLFVFTGGTIGSTFDGSYISVDRGKPYRLLEEYERRYGSLPEYDTLEPYRELSENNTGKTIQALIDCVTACLHSGYDGIVVTHGTDTLQYSAAALAYALGNKRIPVCLVSSNYPIEQPKANGLANLHGAIRFITEKREKGVWVPYQNPGENLQIHRGSRLLASEAYSDCFYSVRNQTYGWLDEQFVFHYNPAYQERTDETEEISVASLRETSPEVLRIEPYPGLVYPAIPEGVKAILHGSYHSGTINSKSESGQRFFAEAAKRKIPVFLSGVSEGASYESTSLFEDLQIVPLPVMSPVAAYVKLWMGLAAGLEPKNLMSRSLGGDIV